MTDHSGDSKFQSGRLLPKLARGWYNGRMLNMRNAGVDDIPLILQFIRELAEYEKAPEQAVATAEDLRRDGFAGNPKFRALIAEWLGKPAGFALFFYHYSTWMGRPTLFLEDLFVRPRFRAKGIGKALLLRLAKMAVDEGCGRFEWQVLDWNTPAIEFYQSLGAIVMKEWLTMRVSGEDLARLAGREEKESEVRSQESE
jgi:GNAT superfamily N-acetyltransferase